jgi:hypothetical protein
MNDLREDRVGGRRPDERLRFVIVKLKYSMMDSFKAGDACERPATDPPSRNLCEESFNLI